MQRSINNFDLHGKSVVPVFLFELPRTSCLDLVLQCAETEIRRLKLGAGGQCETEV